MKLWHDDVRPAPPGWTWARTNEQAIELLSGQHHHGYQVTEISMDHDLGGHDIQMLPPEMGGDAEGYFAKMLYRGSSEETGESLVIWMIENDRVPAKVTIHSWNPAGAERMARRLFDAGHSAAVIPFSFARKTLKG
jgi:hypothetical protein